jgi:integration host factor subunit alpha
LKEVLFMKLTKTHLISGIAKANGLTKKQSSETVEILLEIIKSTLVSGEDVLISGFGKFCVKQKAERLGRNPSTSEAMMLEPRKVVTFRCSGRLKDKINEANIRLSKML